MGVLERVKLKRSLVADNTVDWSRVSIDSRTLPVEDSNHTGRTIIEPKQTISTHNLITYEKPIDNGHRINEESFRSLLSDFNSKIKGRKAKKPSSSRNRENSHMGTIIPPRVGLKEINFNLYSTLADR